MKTIMMNDLEQIMSKGKVNIIDVREKEEFNNGHILGATLIPLSNLQENINKFNRNETYYIVCQSGNRSGMVSQYLDKQGFNVVNVLGGMGAYKGKLTYDL